MARRNVEKDEGTWAYGPKGRVHMASGGLASSSRHGTGAGESTARQGCELCKPIPSVGLPPEGCTSPQMAPPTENLGLNTGVYGKHFFQTTITHFSSLASHDQFIF